MTYTEIDQALKDETTVARIRTATLRWAYSRLANQTRIADQDALAKLVLRGDKRLAETLTRAALVAPTLNGAILADTPAGDTALDTTIATLIPAALAVGVVNVTDPDAQG